MVESFSSQSVRPGVRLKMALEAVKWALTSYVAYAPRKCHARRPLRPLVLIVSVRKCNLAVSRSESESILSSISKRRAYPVRPADNQVPPPTYTSAIYELFYAGEQHVQNFDPAVFVLEHVGFRIALDQF